MKSIAKNFNPMKKLNKLMMPLWNNMELIFSKLIRIKWNNLKKKNFIIGKGLSMKFKNTKNNFLIKSFFFQCVKKLLIN